MAAKPKSLVALALKKTEKIPAGAKLPMMEADGTLRLVTVEQLREHLGKSDPEALSAFHAKHSPKKGAKKSTTKKPKTKKK